VAAEDDHLEKSLCSRVDSERERLYGGNGGKGRAGGSQPSVEPVLPVDDGEVARRAPVGGHFNAINKRRSFASQSGMRDWTNNLILTLLVLSYRSWATVAAFAVVLPRLFLPKR
jgi:hypothetical protein